MNAIRNGTTDSAASQCETLRREVANLATYETNWNGEGALPARPGVVEATLRYLQSIEKYNSPPADAYLAADGTVVLEWHYPDGRVTIANIRVADRAELTHRTPGQAPRFESLPIPPIAASTANGAVPHADKKGLPIGRVIDG